MSNTRFPNRSDRVRYLECVLRDDLKLPEFEVPDCPSGYYHALHLSQGWNKSNRDEIGVFSYFCVAPRGKAPCIQANNTKSQTLDPETRANLHHALKEFDQIKRAEKDLKKLALNPRKRRASSAGLQPPNKKKCMRKDPNVIDLTIEGYDEVIVLMDD